MTDQVSRWRRAADRLGIRIEAPASVEIDGRTATFTARLPDFGAPRGMVVDSTWSAIEPFIGGLTSSGFGYSCVSIGEADDLTEMLLDWGWSSAEPAPAWMAE